MSSGVESFRCSRNGENTSVAYIAREMAVIPEERREVKHAVGGHTSVTLIELDEKTDFILV